MRSQSVLNFQSSANSGPPSINARTSRGDRTIRSKGGSIRKPNDAVAATSKIVVTVACSFRSASKPACREHTLTRITVVKLACLQPARRLRGFLRIARHLGFAMAPRPAGTIKHPAALAHSMARTNVMERFFFHLWRGSDSYESIVDDHGYPFVSANGLEAKSGAAKEKGRCFQRPLVGNYFQREREREVTSRLVLNEVSAACLSDRQSLSWHASIALEPNATSQRGTCPMAEHTQTTDLITKLIGRGMDLKLSYGHSGIAKFNHTRGD